MNLKERVAVFNKKNPDGVPIFELGFDGGVPKKIDPDISYYDICKREDFDSIIADIDYESEAAGVQKKILKKERGTTRLKTTQRTTVPTGGAIRESADLAKYQPPDPKKESILAALKEVIRKYGDKKSIGMHIHDAFNISWYSGGGINKFLIDCIDQEKLVLELVMITTD